MNPPTTDFRTFYPYTPNEVKHRKRTTNSQLKVLESIFKRDTKPNAPLRADLAAQLGMTARGVQVWFQNRRAKEKQKAAKARKTEISNTIPSQEPSSKIETSFSTSTACQANCSPSDTSPLHASSNVNISSSHIQLPVIHGPSWDSLETFAESHPLLSNPSIYPYRRGSLPVNAFLHSEYSYANPSHALHNLTRRLSAGASLNHLPKDSSVYREQADNVEGPLVVPLVCRPSSCHDLNPKKASTIVPYSFDMRRASVGGFLSPPINICPSPIPLSHNPSMAPLFDNNYSAGSRTVSLPLPGPLPSPNYSFGAANASAVRPINLQDNERISSDCPEAFQYREVPDQDDDDLHSAYFVPRFGSVASITTSDSSINSSYYSPLPDDIDPNSRRDSYASTLFIPQMTNLDVNGMGDGRLIRQKREQQLLQEDMGVFGATSGDPHSCAFSLSPLAIESEASSSHTSPSGGTSPVPISKASELANALQSCCQDNHVSQQQDMSAPQHVSLSIIDMNLSQPDELLQSRVPSHQILATHNPEDFNNKPNQNSYPTVCYFSERDSLAKDDPSVISNEILRATNLTYPSHLDSVTHHTYESFAN